MFWTEYPKARAPPRDPRTGSLKWTIPQQVPQQAFLDEDAPVIPLPLQSSHHSEHLPSWERIYLQFGPDAGYFEVDLAWSQVITKSQAKRESEAAAKPKPKAKTMPLWYYDTEGVWHDTAYTEGSQSDGSQSVGPAAAKGPAAEGEAKYKYADDAKGPAAEGEAKYEYADDAKGPAAEGEAKSKKTPNRRLRKGRWQKAWQKAMPKKTPKGSVGRALLEEKEKEEVSGWNPQERAAFERARDILRASRKW